VVCVCIYIYIDIYIYIYIYIYIHRYNKINRTKSIQYERLHAINGIFSQKCDIYIYLYLLNSTPTRLASDRDLKSVYDYTLLAYYVQLSPNQT